MSDLKPLKELQKDMEHSNAHVRVPAQQEGLRRLRKLDEEVHEVEAREKGHGIEHPWIFTERLSRILDGEGGSDE